MPIALALIVGFLISMVDDCATDAPPPTATESAAEVSTAHPWCAEVTP